jgi:HlyD family secretion protein
MTQSSSTRKERRRAPRALWLILLLPAILAIAHFGRPGKSKEAQALFTVARGPLTISVTERGSIDNREKEIVKSNVEGRTTIVSVVDEGTVVKKGDLLIELDASSLGEGRIEQEIKLQNAEAALIQAQESLAIAINQAEADTEEAGLKVRFAVLDLKKYKEGDYPVSLQTAESEITLASEELRNAEDRYGWSTNLADQGYITQIELMTDELAMKRKRIDLSTAAQNRDVLVKYQHDRDLQELESAAKQAEMALERIRRKARADVVKAEADLRARESEHERQQSKLQKIVDQIAACRITAPADGMVVYASSGDGRRYRGGEPLKVGSEVSERQELIHLPTSDALNASIRVQESSLRKVAVGQRALITVDAVPGRVYRGTLTSIPMLPDATRAWLNPDLKVYNCVVELENGAKDLRPGMSCRGEIIVDELPEAVFVPVQCVLRVNGQATAYVASGDSTDKRPIAVGMDNGRMIHVREGLAPGEQVLLTPPLADASVTVSEEPEVLPEPETLPPGPAAEPVPEPAPATRLEAGDGKAPQPSAAPAPGSEQPAHRRERSDQKRPAEKGSGAT